MRSYRVALLGLLLATAPAPAVYAQSLNQSDRNVHVDPVYSGTLPPPPDAVNKLYDRFDSGQRALDGVDDPHRIVVPVSRSVTVAMAAGAQINIVRIAQDYPASITFLDETGQPWPIAWDIASNKNGGCDQDGAGHNTAVRPVGINACVPEPGSNVLQLTPVTRYAHGGVLVSLKGAPKPISFMIVAGTGSYDADLTARIAARGPNARDRPSAGPEIPATGSSFFNAMLDGTPPAEAVPLLVSGGDPDRARAWQYDHHIYLRTNYDVLSPGPTGHEEQYGYVVYEIPETPEVLVNNGAGTQSFPLHLAKDGP
ncbi:DotH/IcmK family type IV secretion protein [Komagataeibacter sp. SM21]|uniref:DotH/IcmK family type IV secretion protein n=1 Tax=Komagataeibacter sp. SM21 TaxID=3242899 RepID=UPI00352909FE